LTTGKHFAATLVGCDGSQPSLAEDCSSHKENNTPNACSYPDAMERYPAITQSLPIARQRSSRPRHDLFDDRNLYQHRYNQGNDEPARVK
jgi:hypothetical protein